MKINLTDGFPRLRKPMLSFMRLFLFLFCTSVFSFSSATLMSQNTTIRFDSDQELTVDQIFDKIIDQTDYTFLYQIGIFDGLPKIKVKKGKIKTNELLSLSIPQGYFKFDVDDKNIIVIERIFQKNSLSPNILQQTIVEGKIMDLDDMPLPGVTIEVKNKNVFHLSNIEGEYSFLVRPTDTLIFTYMGMGKQIVAVNNRTLINIFMEPQMETLDDIVITGYQTLSKVRSAGSYAVVNEEKIGSKLNTNIMDRIEGSVAGISMYKGNIVIRGTSTLFANKKPLYVVDGIPFEGDFESLNPNDITNVTVLKDATAASIYGARSANGVIVITTKTGSSGKLKINYNGSIGFSPLPDRGYANLMSSSEFIDYQTFFFEKGVNSNTNPNSKESLNKVYELLFDKRDGRISETDFNSQIDKYRNQDRYNQVVDEFLNKNSMTTQHNLSFRGGSDFHRYSFSLNYKGTSPYEKEQKSERIGFNLKNSMDLTKRLTVDLGVMYSDKEYDYNSGVFGMSLLDAGKASYYMLRDGSGEALSWDNGKSKKELDRLKGIGILDETYFPANEKDKRRSASKSQYININVGAKMKIFESLNAEVRFQTESTNSYDKIYWTKDSWYAKNMINNATIMNQDGSKTHNIPMGGQVREHDGRNKSYTFRGQLNYSQIFNEIHDVSIIAGAERRRILNEQNGHYRFGYNDTNLSFKNINEVELGKGIFGTESLYGNFWMPINQPQYLSMDDRYISFYSNASYTFKHKLTLNASIRMDQSNLFGTDPKYQYKPLWSLGANYNVLGDNEIHWIDRLAVRATYGINGNVYKDSGPYIISKISPWPNYDTNESSANIISPPNQELRWEKTNTLNLGIDFNLLSHRLIGSFDFYNKSTSDLIGNRATDPTLGWDRLLTNYAQMRNTGIELVLESENVKNSNFQWNSSLLLSYNKNKLTDLENASTSAFSYFEGIQSREGRPNNSLYSIRYAGLNNKGEPQAYKADGTIVTNTSQLTAEDLAYSGTYDPPYNASFSNKFRYKNLELSFMFVYYGGHVMRDVAGSFFPNASNPHYSIISNMDKLHQNIWKEPGDESDLTRLPGYLPGAEMNIRYIWYAADLHIQKADYIKLRDVIITYALPTNITKKVKATGANVVLQGQNLWRWSANKNNLDPEVWSSSQTAYISRGTAIAPTFTIGLNLNF